MMSKLRPANECTHQVNHSEFHFRCHDRHMRESQKSSPKIELVINEGISFVKWPELITNVTQIFHVP